MVGKQQKNSGFALLVSLIVVGVVLSVGLVILDLTIKQVRLAATTKDSEIAFHAANAGMECARYWRRTQSGLAISGVPPTVTITGSDLTGISCFGSQASDNATTPSTVPGTVTATDVSSTHITSGGGNAYQYQYEFTWGPAGEERCTRINKVLTVTPIGAADTAISATNMRSLVPGYPGGSGITCPAGAQCSTVTARGYNQACPISGSFGYGVVEREVLLEF